MEILAFLLQHEAEGPPGVGFGGPFTLNPGLIIWTWVVFVLLFFALKKWAWPEIVKATEEREKRIKQQLEAAEKARAEAERLLEEHKKLMAGAKAEASELIAKAKGVADKEREALVQKARAEQEEILARARREINEEKAKALAELRREAVDLAIAAASRVLETNLSSDANRKLVLDYLKEIR